MWGVAIFKAGTESGRNNPAVPSVLIVCSTYKPACHLSAAFAVFLLLSKKQTVVVTAGLQQVQATMAFICSHLLIEGLLFFPRNANRGGDSSAVPSLLRACSGYKPVSLSSAAFYLVKGFAVSQAKTNCGGNNLAVPSLLRACSRYKPVCHSPAAFLLVEGFVVFQSETNCGGDSLAVPTLLRACSRYKPVCHSSAVFCFFSWRFAVSQVKTNCGGNNLAIPSLLRACSRYNPVFLSSASIFSVRGCYFQSGNRIWS